MDAHDTTNVESQTDKMRRLVLPYLEQHPNASKAEACRAMGVHPQVFYSWNIKRTKLKRKRKLEAKRIASDFETTPRPIAPAAFKVKPFTSDKVVVIIATTDRIASVLKEVWG